MATFNKKLIRGTMLFLITVFATNTNAVNRRFVPMAATDFNYTIENEVQVSDKILEFDLYLLNVNLTTPFEMSQIQAGILVNPAILNGGTITATLISGLSQLPVTSQQPTSITFASNAVKIASKTPPGAGSGSIIGTTAPGTRICRVRLTNTNSFAAGSAANLTFNYTTSPYATKVFQYIAGINTELTCSNSNCFVNAPNIILNNPITAQTVTGSGSYCQGTVGLVVGLASSEAGVTYTLYKNAVATATTVVGTGGAVSFSAQTAGTYTVKGVYGTQTWNITDMTGSAVIAENPIVTASVTIAASSNPVNQGVSVTFTPTQVGGGSTPTYEWFKNTVSVGTGSTYTYTPANNDQLYAIMTSSDTSPCLSGSPATSNTITMSVSLGTGLNNTDPVKITIYSYDKNIFVYCSDKVDQIKVYNAMGIMIKNIQNSSDIHKISMVGNPVGCYIVSLISGKEVYSGKVVLK